MEWLAGKSSSIVVCALLALGGGCAEQPAREAAPVLPPAALKEKTDAEQTYRTCLLNAAHFADDRKSDIAGMALIVAPMCYPEFARFAAASEVGLGRGGLRQFIRDRDRLQMELTDAAIARERSETTMSASR